MGTGIHLDGPVGPVVVGCDGSWPGGQAVLAAAAAARRRGAQLKLLVLERPTDTVTPEHGVAAEHAAYVGETARLQAHRAEPDVDTEVVVVADLRDERVDRLARHAGLLVLGSYGAGGQVALSLGTASDALARAFACPILLPHARVGESLRAGTRPPTVVAAVGRNDAAHHVVAAAAREAAERHVPLLILHTLSMQDAAEFASEQVWVATVLTEVGVPAWLPHRTVVTVADPVAAVLDRIQSDDLLVVATRGQGRLAGLVSGSVTRALLDAGQCDVLVVDHGIISHDVRGLDAGGLDAGGLDAGGLDAGGLDAGGLDGAGVDAAGLDVRTTIHLARGPEPANVPNAAATLSDSECWAFLSGAAVGRLGVCVDGQQDIFPVNHVVSRGSVVFRTAEGTKLDACVDQPVAFEVDGFDSASGDAWSVVVKGTARELVERDEIIRALRLPLAPWPGDPKPRIVQIDPGSGRGGVSGRRFHVFGGLTALTSSAMEGWLSSPGPDRVPAHR